MTRTITIALRDDVKIPAEDIYSALSELAYQISQGESLPAKGYVPTPDGMDASLWSKNLWNVGTVTETFTMTRRETWSVCGECNAHISDKHSSLVNEDHHDSCSLSPKSVV